MICQQFCGAGQVPISRSGLCNLKYVFLNVFCIIVRDFVPLGHVYSANKRSYNWGVSV